MKENKLTPEEVKKASECCIKPTRDCENCPYFKEEECFDIAKRVALNLIVCQQAEIERLNNNISAMATTLSNSAKATRNEAIKEFVERLKQKVLVSPYDVNLFAPYTDNLIDNLVKEMAGEQE